MKRIKYKITNGNSGILDLEGTDVTVSGRDSAEAYLTPGLKDKLENTARVTVSAIPETLSVETPSQTSESVKKSAAQERRKDTGQTRQGRHSGGK